MFHLVLWVVLFLSIYLDLGCSGVFGVSIVLGMSVFGLSIRSCGCVLVFVSVQVGV